MLRITKSGWSLLKTLKPLPQSPKPIMAWPDKRLIYITEITANHGLFLLVRHFLHHHLQINVSALTPVLQPKARCRCCEIGLWEELKIDKSLVRCGLQLGVGCGGIEIGLVPRGGNPISERVAVKVNPCRATFHKSMRGLYRGKPPHCCKHTHTSSHHPLTCIQDRECQIQCKLVKKT